MAMAMANSLSVCVVKVCVQIYVAYQLLINYLQNQLINEIN